MLIFIKRGYDPIILQHTACLVVSPYTVGNHAYLFGCAMTGRIDDVGLNPETEGRHRITVLNLFGRALYSFFCNCSYFRQVIEYSGYWLKQFIYPNNISMFYISLHAVLPLLMLQIYRTGITFIYTVRFVGDKWDEGEV